MKKHILLLGIFLSLTVFLSVQAGNTVIDSLKQEIRQAEREPSSKEKLIELYQFLGAEYETLDHDSSYHYIQKGLSLYPRPAFEEEGYQQIVLNKQLVKAFQSSTRGRVYGHVREIFEQYSKESN